MSPVITAPGFPNSELSIDFAAALDDLLAKHADAAGLRSAWDSPMCRIPGLWGRLEEIGLFEMAADSGLRGLVDLVPAVVVLGHHANPEPTLGTLAVAVTTGIPNPVISAVVAGPGPLVPDATVAGQFALAADDGGFELVGSGELEVMAQPSLDPAARLGHISRGAYTGGGQLFDVIATLAAAQLQGLAEGLLTQAVNYAKVREQFGKPIGSFQVIKHQLADVYGAVAFSRPVLDDAARSVSAGEPDAEWKVSHAKARTTAAARLAARTALQVHGGIGYTFEHDLHMWTKKVWTLSTIWGDARWHAARVTAAVLDGSR